MVDLDTVIEQAAGGSRKRTQVSVLSTIARFTVFAALVVGSSGALAMAAMPTIGAVAGSVAIVQCVDWLYPETLKPSLRRVINWLFMLAPDRP